MARQVKPIGGLAEPLVAWYHRHERAFPWRTDPSPYRVWVSEIMLQQTRIEAALPYFERFMQALPTVEALAAANEGTLLKLWEGLGYYSRVRNLQKAAQVVVSAYGGELPPDVDALRRLPGIGDYTAGAIASMAFGIRAAAVDGNVLRVMARLLDDPRDVMQTKPRRELSALVETLVPVDEPGAFNQGLMELGETVCLPHAVPRCAECPVQEFCAVAGLERARDLPTRSLPASRRREYRTVFTVITEETPRRVLIHKRPADGLLGGMWELPQAEATQGEAAEVPPWLAPSVRRRECLKNGKHIFSHVEWQLSGCLLYVRPCPVPEGYRWVDAEEWETVALPTAFRTYSAGIPALLKEEVQ